MNVTQEEFQNMKEEIVKEMVSYRMEMSGCTMLQAFDEIYRSRTFERLCDPNTGLFFQSPRYVYAYLEEEMSSKSQRDDDFYRTQAPMRQP